MADRFTYNSPVLKDRRRRLRSASTTAENHLWQYLRGNKLAGLRFFRQYSVGPYILDFYCPARRLGVEIDGRHHAEMDVQAYDDERTNFLNAKRITVLRFWNQEIETDIHQVLSKIKKALPFA